MRDLTEDQLTGMSMWGDDRETFFNERHKACGAMLVRMAVDEIRRRRAADSTKDATNQRRYELVSRIVGEVLSAGLPNSPNHVNIWSSGIARLVADAMGSRDFTDDPADELYALVHRLVADTLNEVLPNAPDSRNNWSRRIAALVSGALAAQEAR